MQQYDTVNHAQLTYTTSESTEKLRNKAFFFLFFCTIPELYHGRITKRTSKEPVWIYAIIYNANLLGLVMF